MRASLIFLLLNISLTLAAQDWQLVTTIKADDEIASTSSDSKDMFYIGTTSGNLIRYDQFGEEDEYFSALNTSPLSSIQAWNRLKLFAFYKEQQSVGILDRFATSPQMINLRDLNLQYAWLFAPGVDHSYWALSTEFRELVKYDEQNLAVLFKIALANNVEIRNATVLRAFKNLLILVDKEAGIFIFDQYGKMLGTVNEPGIESIQIKENLIHTTNGKEYLTIDPFSLKTLKKVPLPKQDIFALEVVGSNVALFSSDKVFLYRMR